jgi:hypothetical protein
MDATGTVFIVGFGILLLVVWFVVHVLRRAWRLYRGGKAETTIDRILAALLIGGAM